MEKELAVDFSKSFQDSAGRSGGGSAGASPPQEGLPRCASAPIGLQLGGAGGEKFICKALVLTTPRRKPQRRQRAQAQLRPLASPASGGAAGSGSPSGPSPKGVGSPPGKQASPANAGPRPLSSGYGQTPAPKLRAPKPRSPSDFTQSGLSDGGSDSEGISAVRVELVRLRKQLHKQACEFQDTRNELAQRTRELRQARAEADELRLKLGNLERIDRTKSSELLEERRKNDEMSKQVKEMSANLLSLTGSLDGGNQEGSGLRKRCFKLVQQNTALSIQARLLQRQKGWAEAKARVLQNEVTRVYLGVHERVKDDPELEAAMSREFVQQQFPTDEAQIYQLLMPCESVHQEAIIDFVTHITHTGGQDIHGFLQSSKVFSEGIRNDCLSGLAREFYATWRRNASLPHILRAVERIVHLSDYLTAFESFASEITTLLGCAHAKIWVVDRFRQCMWSCVRDGDGQKTFTLSLPRGKNADLTGKGVAAAAYLTQKPVTVADAREDPRFRAGEEAGPDGHAKSIMCVPVSRVPKAGRQPQVRVVLQAVNKLQEPHFDPERDGRILRLLGKVSMEVLQVCETSSAATMNTKRKEALLQLFNDHTPCDTPQTLLGALERGLAETFMSQAVALHTVDGHATTLATINKHQNKLSLVHFEGMRGIIGSVAKTMNQNTTLASQIESSRYDTAVDLPANEKTVIHTVPICAGSATVAVCQFICPERERNGGVSDDGAFHPENSSHFRLLTLLLTFVQKHLHVLAPKPHAEEEGRGDRARPAAPAQSAPGGDGGRALAADKGADGGKSVRFKRSNTVHGGDNFGDDELEAAAIKIQAMQRGRLARRQSAAKKQQHQQHKAGSGASQQRRASAAGGKLSLPGAQSHPQGGAPKASPRRRSVASPRS